MVDPKYKFKLALNSWLPGMLYYVNSKEKNKKEKKI